MKVSEFIKFLEQFPDQDAEVFVVEHHCGKDAYEQGGTAQTVNFDPEIHIEYTDFRGNQFVKPTDAYFETRQVLIGATWM